MKSSERAFNACHSERDLQNQVYVVLTIPFTPPCQFQDRRWFSILAIVAVIKLQTSRPRKNFTLPPPPFPRGSGVDSFAALLLESCLHSPRLRRSRCRVVRFSCDLEAWNLVTTTIGYRLNNRGSFLDRGRNCLFVTASRPAAFCATWRLTDSQNVSSIQHDTVAH
jgi:hypothetical protein